MMMMMMMMMMPIESHSSNYTLFIEVFISLVSHQHEEISIQVAFYMQIVLIRANRVVQSNFTKIIIECPNTCDCASTTDQGKSRHNQFIHPQCYIRDHRLCIYVFQIVNH